MKTVCIYGKGGLGDTLKGYFWTGQEDEGLFDDGWQYVEAIKKSHPEVVIKYIAMSANQYSAEFYRHHPCIDEVVQGEWLDPRVPDDGAKIRKYLGDAVLLSQFGFKGLKPKRQNKLYLGPDDLQMIGKISALGKYVVVHPFSGGEKRMVMPIQGYVPIIRRLVHILGVPVVVIGGNYTKKLNKPVHKCDSFDHGVDGMVNLVNQTNLRVAAQIILNAMCTVSVRSFSCALSKSGLTKSVVLVSSKSYMSKKETINSIKSMGWEEHVIDKNMRIIDVGKSCNEKIIDGVLDLCKKTH